MLSLPYAVISAGEKCSRVPAGWADKIQGSRNGMVSAFEGFCSWEKTRFIL